MIAQTDQGIRFLEVREIPGLGEASTQELADKALSWLKTNWYIVAVAALVLFLLRSRR